VIDDDILTPAPAAEVIENVCQLAEPELTGSTTTVRVVREAEGWLGFGHRHHVPRV
jgi:hypothetical protein